MAWLQEPYGLNWLQCKTGYKYVFSKNHFPHLHRILRGRQSWNMQVVIERLKITHFSTVKAQGSDDRNTHSFHPARKKKRTISPRLNHAPRTCLLQHRAPTILCPILLTSSAFGAPTLCSWGALSSSPGRLRVYFMKPLSSIFLSCSKSHFNNKNIFILRIRFHNIFPAPICSEISKTQTHASPWDGPGTFNPLYATKFWFWLFCSLGIRVLWTELCPPIPIF